MYKDLRISIVIPCFNEEEGIAKVINSMPSYVDEILAIDNNSTDATSSIARSLGARVIFERRKGYGRSYKTSLPLANGDIIATLDGDGTYPSREIAGIIDFMLENGLDFVSTSRFPLKNRSSMKFLNKLGNTILNIAMTLLLLRVIRDSQSGMWVFKKDILPLMNLRSDGMSFSEEIKIEAITNKEIKFGEYHIEYFERIGQVKLSKWKDGMSNLVFLFRKCLQINLHAG